MAKHPEKHLPEIVKTLKEEYKKYTKPIVTELSFEGDPFKVLFSTILSLRTKDAVTAEASRRLFAIAKSPKAVLSLPTSELEKIIYPVGFYKTKAQTLHKVAQLLIDNHKGKVPQTEEELLALPGVGRKTANLVLSLGFDVPAICVDTHVHRISNRLGLITTKNPEETEYALQKVLPKQYWIVWNDLLVSYGQNHCVPISPWCSTCRIRKFCEQKGVDRSR